MEAANKLLKYINKNLPEFYNLYNRNPGEFQKIISRIHEIHDLINEDEVQRRIDLMISRLQHQSVAVSKIYFLRDKDFECLLADGIKIPYENRRSEHFPKCAYVLKITKSAINPVTATDKAYTEINNDQKNGVTSEKLKSKTGKKKNKRSKDSKNAPQIDIRKNLEGPSGPELLPEVSDSCSEAQSVVLDQPSSAEASVKNTESMVAGASKTLENNIIHNEGEHDSIDNRNISVDDRTNPYLDTTRLEESTLSSTQGDQKILSLPVSPEDPNTYSFLNPNTTEFRHVQEQSDLDALSFEAPVYIKCLSHTYRSFHGNLCFLLIITQSENILVSMHLNQVRNFGKLDCVPKIFCCYKCLYIFVRDVREVCCFGVFDKKCSTYTDWRIQPMNDIMTRLVIGEIQKVCHKLKHLRFEKTHKTPKTIVASMAAAVPFKCLRNSAAHIVSNFPECLYVCEPDFDLITTIFAQNNNTIVTPVLREVLKLRYFIAINTDESVHYVLTDNQVLQLCDKKDIHCLSRCSALFRQYSDSFAKILSDFDEKEAVEDEREDVDQEPVDPETIHLYADQQDDDIEWNE